MLKAGDLHSVCQHLMVEFKNLPQGTFAWTHLLAVRTIFCFTLDSTSLYAWTFVKHCNEPSVSMKCREFDYFFARRIWLIIQDGARVT